MYYLIKEKLEEYGADIIIDSAEDIPGLAGLNADTEDR